MDPLTAALNLAASIVTLWTKILDAMPPESKQDYAKMAVDDLKTWHDALKPLFPK